MAVAALDIQPSDNVLDLCCAPGSKLLYVANIMDPPSELKEKSSTLSNGTVTGVDLSKNRLHVCKSLLSKYSVTKVRLFRCDGTTFNVHCPSRVGKWINHRKEPDTSLSVDANSNQCNSYSKPFYQTQLLAGDLQTNLGNATLYDKVLVDAECTHDGSIAHVKKYKSSLDGQLMFDALVLDPDRLAKLQKLQVNYTF